MHVREFCYWRQAAEDSPLEGGHIDGASGVSARIGVVEGALIGAQRDAVIRGIARAVVGQIDRVVAAGI